jgi:hypothetical protein
MRPKLTKLVVLSLIFLVLMPVQIVFADTGPKPTMDFAFDQTLLESDLQVISGILYECDQPDCSDAAPLQEVGPQRFTCDTTSCQATAYGFAPYHKIEIEFSDEQTRQSNVFQTAGFASSYTVTVRPDDLLVKAKFSLGFLPPVFIIIITCVCALVGIGLVVGIIVFLIRRSKKN